jgi:hypothetical protein
MPSMRLLYITKYAVDYSTMSVSSFSGKKGQIITANDNINDNTQYRYYDMITRKR